jgi:uncharacterized protein YggU (UPF0235/DUF167 family)
LARTSAFELPVRIATDGIRVAIRLTPRGRADRIDGMVRDADGEMVLKVSVTAPPVDARANDALLLLLAREWRLPRRDLSLVSGARNRNKIVHLAGEPTTLLTHIGAALAVLPRP